MVDPEYIEAKLGDIDPSSETSIKKPLKLAKGILAVQLSRIKLDSETATNYEDGTKWCVLRIDDQRYVSNEINQDYQEETFPFMIFDLKKKLSVKIKSKRMKITTLITTEQLSLSMFNYESGNKEIIELQRINSRNPALSMTLHWQPLPTIKLLLSESELIQHLNYQDGESGVLYICVHRGQNLMSMDSDGYSDPYCTVFMKNRKIGNTSTVHDTLNPEWEYSLEVLVQDYSETKIQFKVHDFDGLLSSDDFLGSCELQCNNKLPVLIEENLPLYRKSEKCGFLVVSIIFRSYKGVDNHDPNRSNDAEENKQSVIRRKGTKVRRYSHFLIDSFNPRQSSIQGFQTAIQVTVHSVRDISDKDSKGGGCYCEIKSGMHSSFKTKTMNKTNQPTWNESFEVPISEGGILKISVIEKGLLKTVAGSIKFNFEDIMKQVKDSKEFANDSKLQPTRNSSSALLAIDSEIKYPQSQIRKNRQVDLKNSSKDEESDEFRKSPIKLILDSQSETPSDHSSTFDFIPDLDMLDSFEDNAIVRSNSETRSLLSNGTITTELRANSMDGKAEENDYKLLSSKSFPKLREPNTLDDMQQSYPSDRRHTVNALDSHVDIYIENVKVCIKAKLDISRHRRLLVNKKSYEYKTKKLPTCFNPQWREEADFKGAINANADSILLLKVCYYEKGEYSKYAIGSHKTTLDKIFDRGHHCNKWLSCGNASDTSFSRLKKMASGFSAFRALASRRFSQGLVSGQTKQAILTKRNSLVRYSSSEGAGAKRDLGLGGIVGVFAFFSVCILGIPLVVGLDVGQKAKERALKAENE
ncbi:uncharacterized protein TRIADDRAFT_63502 [Trichoplax adhaerens]|uniref:C2 domain-containing protein n=1 Tax=Trichoplax adhaerens TaxID=10228 RepID=B3RL93_TRIAD|nr:predicted protein [Trichoplax adhaerens]EDV28725.1 predicted protein [Trichoplax adhaerens]|eukprot:XP_002107927.1 predicted protein [Trichoplax adhaerens]